MLTRLLSCAYTDATQPMFSLSLSPYYVFAVFDGHYTRAQYIFTAKELIMKEIAAYYVSAVSDKYHARPQYIFTKKNFF